MRFASMWRHLEQIVNSLSHDAEIRAVVISGRGPKAFTAGLDVRVYDAGKEEGVVMSDVEAENSFSSGRRSSVQRKRDRAEGYRHRYSANGDQNKTAYFGVPKQYNCDGKVRKA